MPFEIVVPLIDKLAILAIGVAFGVMAYRLFLSGLYEQAEQVKAASQPEDVLWKQVLPGTLFALFAGVIVIVGLRQPPIVSAAGHDRSVESPPPSIPLAEPTSPFPSAEAGSNLMGHPLNELPLPREIDVEAGSVLSLDG